ncbi:MAG: hypothetical protein U0325_14290 [Polyangiales bacterium]
MRALLPFALLTACASTPPTTNTLPPASPLAPPGTAPSSDGQDEVRALLTEALTPQLCPRLLGSFLGLPGESDLRGPASGTVASVGRWWIRSCDARVERGRLSLALGGSGWTWVDRESDGFRVRQYLLFDASASLGADVSVGYDRTTRIASLWMTPANGVQAQITPRGMVSAEATGFFSTILGGVAALTGTTVSDRARVQAGELGSTQLRERLAGGFTMTVSLDTRQVDFMVGALQRGEVPQRPYPPAGEGVWLINQRSTVWPGGLDVVGPLDLDAAPLTLDVTLEEGDGAVIQAACSEDLGRYFDARLRDPSATPAAPRWTPIATLRAGTATQTLTLPRALPEGNGCQALLTLAPPAGSTLPTRLRYRVMPRAGSPTRPSTPRPATAATPTRRVRVQLVGVTVRPDNASGRAWDIIGGEADVLVRTASVPMGREIDRTPVVADHNTATFTRWLPSAFELPRDLPLRFSVFDDDSTTEELIGTADLEATAVPDATGELTLPVRTTGAVPVQTGTLRLRVEVLP